MQFEKKKKKDGGVGREREGKLKINRSKGGIYRTYLSDKYICYKYE